MLESLKLQQPVKKRGNRKNKPKRSERSAEKVSEKPRRDHGSRPAAGPTRHHFLAILSASVAALALLALVSEAGPHWAGPLGHRLALALLRPLGLLSFLVPAALLLGAGVLVGLVRPSFRLLRFAVALGGGIVGALLFCAIVAPRWTALGAPVHGEWLAAAGAPIAASLSVVGGGLLTFAVTYACFSVLSGHALSRATLAFLRVTSRLSARAVAAASRWAGGALTTAVQEHREARTQRLELSDPEGLSFDSRDASGISFAPDGEDSGTVAARRQSRRAAVPPRPAEGEEPSAETPTDATPAETPEILTIGEDGRIRNGALKPDVEPIALIEGVGVAGTVEEEAAPAPQIVGTREPPLRRERALAITSPGPLPLTPSLAAPSRKRGGAFQLSRTGTGFVLPGVELLDLPPDVHQDIDRNALTDTAQKLTQKLADFGIKGRVETIRPGPVITMYEFVPAPGIRVSKIASLADDLAMAMEALQVRIVAPIPGKSVVGIEVPNRQRQKVYLREILEEDGFAKMTSPLTLAFGKDTEGVPYVGDLSRMPHLLVAGTTGSGKSVSMNSMIMSLLFKASPEDVRMIMIDPKMVELSMYEGIPHLLLPVVQDAQKAPLALRWAVDEMERRYHLIGKLKVKDLKQYNEKVARLKQGDKPEEPEAPKKVLVVDVAKGETEEELLARLAAEGAAATEPAVASSPVPGVDIDELEKLPYIVIIIDELADLMMVASRDVEQSIARLAAKARAAGIHLVIATQRPSTNVISGVIKSNLPVRIAFRLASRHDSATIINGPGAERLLGEGDMLHIPPGCSDALRLHGAWLREAEIERVVDFWKAQGKPVYDEEILKPRLADNEDGAEDAVPDELYDEALAVVCQLEKVSISLLQRKMGIGYNRAADLIERMERDGVIGPANGIKPREVLIKELGESRL